MPDITWESSWSLYSARKPKLILQLMFFALFTENNECNDTAQFDNSHFTDLQGTDNFTDPKVIDLWIQPPTTSAHQ